LVRDYERLPETSEAFIYLAMIRVMVKRLAEMAPKNFSNILLEDESWQLGILISIPNDYSDPRKRCSCWKAKLDTGSEIYVWEPSQIKSVAQAGKL
jgi:hypothetical protein